MVIWNLIIHCERIPPLITSFVNSFSSLFFLFWNENLSSNFLANPSCTNTMLSTTVTMLYIRSSGSYSPYSWKFAPFYQPLPISRPAVTWQSHFSTLASMSLTLKRITPYLNDTLQYLSSYAWHFTWHKLHRPQGPVLSHMAEFLAFIWQSNIKYVCVRVYLFMNVYEENLFHLFVFCGILRYMIHLVTDVLSILMIWKFWPMILQSAGKH